MFSFTSWPLYLRYTLHRGLNGPQSRSERCGNKSVCPESIPDSSVVQPRAPYCSPFSDRRFSTKSFHDVHYFSLLSGTDKNLYHNALCPASSIHLLLPTFLTLRKWKEAYDVPLLSVCLYVYSPIKFWMPESIFIKLGTSAYLNVVLHESFPSVIPTLQTLKFLSQDLDIAWKPLSIFIKLCYVYHSTWIHIKGVLDKSLRSVIPTLLLR
jgi:hypothetical protein